jgi:hypothetical protein
MPVSLAPSIRSKLRSITAKDGSQPPLREPRWKLPVTEMLAAAATLRDPIRRFWDSDSEFECEDLGIAVDRPVELSQEFERARPVVAASPQIRRTSAKPASTPPHRPPWRNLWKGPLPPARVSPARTLADLLPPTFSAVEQDGAAAGSPAGRRSWSFVNKRISVRWAQSFAGPLSTIRSVVRVPVATRPVSAVARHVSSYRDPSGAGRVSNHNAAVAEPCTAARPTAPPGERGCTSASALLHSVP